MKSSVGEGWGCVCNELGCFFMFLSTRIYFAIVFRVSCQCEVAISYVRMWVMIHVMQ